MQQLTANTNSTDNNRPRGLQIVAILLALLILTACTWSLVALADRARQQFAPSPADLALQANRLRWLELWGKLWPPLSVVLAGLGVLFLIALAWTLLRWLGERAVESHAHGGVFPVKALRAWSWQRVGRFWLPAQAVVYHDPNRSAGPTTIYTPTFDGSAMAVRQVSAQAISPEQLRITQGAQLTQIAAAVAQSEHSPTGRRLGQQVVSDARRRTRDWDSDTWHAPLWAPQLPPARILPIDGSHIERLMREQGILIPGDPGDSGQPAI